MERFSQRRPSKAEIFDALADEDTSPDWDSAILSRADPSDISEVRGLLRRPEPIFELRYRLDGRR